MAKVIGPLFSMIVSGSLGGIIFDRRGFVRSKGFYRDPKTKNQGDFRQVMRVVQRGIKLCGPQTRQQLRQVAPDPARWSAYLVKQVMGPQRANYAAYVSRFAGPDVAQAGWEAAARGVGLREIRVEYASQAGVSPGLQLFVLAAALFELNIYTELGPPAANAGDWAAWLVS
ncbi:MAG: hypothetical protein AB1801_01040 [Chloroflexota bacterium]